MACCTASTVYEYLPYDMREIACPIILPTARRAAEITESGSVGVIATRATVASGAFRKALSGYQKCRSVFENGENKYSDNPFAGIEDYYGEDTGSDYGDDFLGGLFEFFEDSDSSGSRYRSHSSRRSSYRSHRSSYRSGGSRSSYSSSRSGSRSSSRSGGSRRGGGGHRF